MEYRIRKNEQGFTHYVLLLFMVLLVGTFTYIGAKRIITSQADTLGDFSYVTTDASAAAQPTTMGRNILTLKAYNGKLYPGYGDYGANTGPIAITPFDPATNTFAGTTSLVFGSEQIDLYRVINSKLYTASVDPDAVTPSYYASGDTTGTWTQRLVNAANGPLMEHVFDINTLNGTDLYLAGSQGNDAIVYRSTDGGTTWTKSLDLAVPNRMERFYAIGSFNGRLYVQASSVDLTNTTAYPLEATSHVFDGTSWSNGPSLGSGYYIGHVETFAGKMVYLNFCTCNSIGNGTLSSLSATGGVQTVTTPAGVYNYSIDGSTLYILATNGNIYSTTDLSNWYLQASGITTGASLAILNGQIYVGTRDSKIYKAPVNNNPVSVTGGTTSGSGGTTTKTHGNGGGGGGHKK